MRTLHILPHSLQSHLQPQHATNSLNPLGRFSHYAKAYSHYTSDYSLSNYYDNYDNHDNHDKYDNYNDVGGKKEKEGKGDKRKRAVRGIRVREIRGERVIVSDPNRGRYFRSQGNQRKFLERIVEEYQLPCLSALSRLSLTVLKKLGGGRLVELYARDLPLLLRSLFPHFPWPPARKKERRKHYHHLLHQRQFMDSLFFSSSLSSLADWLLFPPHRIIRAGGRSLLLYYSRSLPLLLSSVYPHYPWPSPPPSLPLPLPLPLSPPSAGRPDQVIAQTSAQLSSDLSLPSRCHPFILSSSNPSIPSPTSTTSTSAPASARMEGGCEVMGRGDRREEMTMERRREMMERVFVRLKLSTLQEWRGVSRCRIRSHGGRPLLALYAGDLHALLRSLYPHFPWHFPPHYPLRYFTSLANQRRYLDRLYAHLALTSLADWQTIPTSALLRHHGGVRLLRRYSFLLPPLFSSVYPHYPWDPAGWGGSAKRKITMMMRAYAISRESDWLRIADASGQLRALLTAAFADHPWATPWAQSPRQLRAKKCAQRRLFACARSLFPRFDLLENYRHPLLSSHEYDLFLPALNVAVEYQGEQHYHDIPSNFSFAASYQLHDRFKASLSSSLSIPLVCIPYWWDRSPHSLSSTLRSLFSR